MLFTLFLIILFVGSIGVLWHRISEKIPELIAIPDEVIVARLHEDSARVRIFILHARTFWREPRYRIVFWRFCEKICHRTHIALLKTDNALMGFAKKTRGYADIADAEEATHTVAVMGQEREIFQAIYPAASPAAVEPAREGLAGESGQMRTTFVPVDHVHSEHPRMQEVRKRGSKATISRAA